SADVEPEGKHRLDGSREWRARGDEIEVPDETDARRDGQLVVDHLVEGPAIARLVRIAVSAWDGEDGLFFAAAEEEAALAVAPDGVVEMDDVHRRHLAVDVVEIGTHAHDVAVDRRLLVLRDRDQLDRVLPRQDPDRRRLEVEMLDAGLVRPRPRRRRG